MAIHGSQVKVFIDGYDVSSFFPNLLMEANQAVHERTAFGDSGRVKVPGLKDGKASGECFVDPTALTGSLAILKARYGATPGTPNPVSILRGLNGLVVGNPVDLGYFNTSSLQFKFLETDLEKATFNAESEEDAIDYGVSLHALTPETAFPFSGTSVDNSVSTANGGVGVAAITAIGGSSPNATIKIQHSSNNSTWVDLITFAAVSAANSIRRVEVSGTINRYLRVLISDSGVTTSVTPAVAFARR